MKVTLEATTGAKLDMWREKDLFHVQRTDQLGVPQSCLGVDLFEVIAELAQLNLEDGTQAAEAISLAERAQRHLHAV